MIKKLLFLALMLTTVNIPVLQAQHVNGSGSEVRNEAPYETPAPVLTYEEVIDAVIFTATGEGTVTLYIQYIDNMTGEMTTQSYAGNGVVSVQVLRDYEDTYVNVWAIAQANEDAIPGVTSIQYYIVIPALIVPEITASPEFVVEEAADYVRVTAIGSGWICLYLDEQLVAEGEGSASYYIPYSDEPEGEEYCFMATAKEEGKEISEYTLWVVYVPGKTVPYETPAPEWTYELAEDAVIFTATGEGVVTLYIQYIDNMTGGITTQSYVGNGVVSVSVPRVEEDTYINLWATAQADEDAIPGITPVEYYIEIPAKAEIQPGDADGNGSVTIADVTAIIDYLLSPGTSSVNFAGADFNNDGQVTIADVTEVIDYILSLGK